MGKWPFDLLEAAPSNPLGPGGKALIQRLRRLLKEVDRQLGKLEKSIDVAPARARTRAKPR